MTPEGQVKKKIKELLDSHKPHLYCHMAVPVGYGDQTVDFLGCYSGYFFGIEAKAPGKKPTPRQDEVLDAIERAGGRSFVISGEAGLERLAGWLKVMRAARRIADQLNAKIDAKLGPLH